MAHWRVDVSGSPLHGTIPHAMQFQGLPAANHERGMQFKRAETRVGWCWSPFSFLPSSRNKAGAVKGYGYKTGGLLRGKGDVGGFLIEALRTAPAWDFPIRYLSSMGVLPM